MKKNPRKKRSFCFHFFFEEFFVKRFFEFFFWRINFFFLLFSFELPNLIQNLLSKIGVLIMNVFSRLVSHSILKPKIWPKNFFFWDTFSAKGRNLRRTFKNPASDKNLKHLTPILILNALYIFYEYFIFWA